MKRIAAGIITVLILVMLSVIPAYANAGQSYWRGFDSMGSVVVGENCPIEVKSELLTFDITEFPHYHYEQESEFLAYGGKVTAEYTFYNPADYEVTATLVFPFGSLPDYAYIQNDNAQFFITNADADKYNITVDGDVIEKRIRYSLRTEYGFDPSNDIPRLSDSYLSDNFYSPTTTVTKYTYVVGGENGEDPIDEENYRHASVAFDWDGGDGTTRLFLPESYTLNSQWDDDMRFSMKAYNEKEFSVYAIGQPFETPLTMQCYEGAGAEDETEIGGTVSLTNTETMTFEELALETWKYSTGVSKADWYNAVVIAFLYSGSSFYGMKYNYVDLNNGLSLFEKQYARDFMRWYEYEITIPPGESIVNTVTAPLYPAIDIDGDPAIYSYTYLLSPASTWASFGDLEVRINTPYFLNESTLDGFEKTENGYTLKRVGLPDGELEFTLSTSEKIQNTNFSVTDYIPREALIVISVACGVLLLAIVVIIIKKRS